MRTTPVRIDTKDSLELFGLLYEPDTQSSKVLVHVHGMGGNFYENKFVDFLATTLTANGFAFFAFNNRGCEFIKDLYKVIDGKRTFVQIGEAYEKFEECILDIGAAIDFVSTKGFSEIHLSGHSLGSPKVVYYLTEIKDARVNSVLLLSPSDMLGLVRDNPVRFAEDLSVAQDFVAQGKGDELLPNHVWDEYPISASTYLNFFADGAKTAVFNFHDATSTLPVLAKITQPLFAVMGRKDDALTVSVEETMERIKKAARATTKVETVILGDADHGYTGDEQKLADAVVAWIKSVSGAQA